MVISSPAVFSPLIFTSLFIVTEVAIIPMPTPTSTSFSRPIAWSEVARLCACARFVTALAIAGAAAAPPFLLLLVLLTLLHAFLELFEALLRGLALSLGQAHAGRTCVLLVV
jgi:hypothetical protein